MSKAPGEIALVCGATGPLGRRISHALSADGHRLILHTRSNSTALDRLGAELGDGVIGTRIADLADVSAAAELVDGPASAGEAPSVLVVSLYGYFEPLPVHEEPPENVDIHLASFRAHVNICQSFLRMRRDHARGGRIIVVTGALSHRIFPGFALVSSMKSALDTFCRTLALEAGGHGITVNCVAPGRIEDAPVSPPHASSPEPSPSDNRSKLAEMSRQRMALDSFPTSGDVAGVVSFLASPAARQVTGQTIFLAAGEPVG